MIEFMRRITQRKHISLSWHVDFRISLLALLRIALSCVMIFSIIASIVIIISDPALDGCDNDSDSLALDLSTNRPDWSPRERYYQDYAAWAESLTPSFNREPNSRYAVCGDERRFILVRQADSDEKYSRVITVKQEVKYEVYIFFRNGNPVDDDSATSHGTRIFLDYPSLLYEPGKLTATIRSDNALPASITASAVVQPAIGIDSTYLQATSAALFTGSGRKAYDIPVSEITGKSGAMIGCSEPNGEITAGCYGHIIVRFTAKRISLFTGVSAGESPRGPWKNSQVLERSDPFWVRFRFVNTGQIPVEDVSVAFRFGIDFPWSIYIDTPRSPYMEGSHIGRKNIDLDTLVQGVNLATVDPGNSVNLFVPIAVGVGWQEKLCDGPVDIEVSIKSKIYLKWTQSVIIYPDNWLCEK